MKPRKRRCAVPGEDRFMAMGDIGMVQAHCLLQLPFASLCGTDEGCDERRGYLSFFICAHKRFLAESPDHEYGSPVKLSQWALSGESASYACFLLSHGL